MAIPTGEIYLLKNVPLTSTYEHTIDFKDASEQFSYFYSFLKKHLTKFTYVRKEREFITVELPITELDDINYLIFRAAEGERLYYAFVSDKVYSNPNATTIFYSIDVLQTFQFDYKWKPSYIKQGHVDRWTPELKPIYSKTDEGLAYGSEYTVESAYRLQQSSSIKWLLVSVSSYKDVIPYDFAIESSRINPASSPFVCFLVPIGINGASKFYWRGERDSEIAGDMIFNRAMRNGALGNYVVSVSLMTYNPFIKDEVIDGDKVYFTPDASIAELFTVLVNYGEGDEANEAVILTISTADLVNASKTLAITEWNTGLTNSMPTAAQWEEIKANPYTTKRDKRYESKLLCAPYRYNLLTDWRNEPIILKNEYMPVDKLAVKYSMALSHNVPFRFWVEGYKNDPEGRYTSLMQPLAPEFPILNDAYYTYMLQNKNTIQANLTNALIGAGTGVVTGAISGATGGAIAGPYGALAGAAIGAVSGAAGGVINVSSLIRSENAKQADLRAKPDTIVNSNDSTFNIVDKNVDVNFYRMKICCENEEILAEIFNMYGYKVNRVDVPNIRSRSRFNYLQVYGANISGDISQIYIEQIKNIFMNGITVWHYNKEHFNMLDYSLENIEVNLI